MQRLTNHHAGAKRNVIPALPLNRKAGYTHPMSTQTHNPHDTFFRKTMGDINVTRNLLQHELPEQIASLLDFSSIERVDGTYVSKSLQNTYSDMVFRVKFRDSEKHAYIYTLFEHKSYVDDWCSLQLLKYMAAQWEDFHSNNPKEKLPPIIPLVLYHGKQGWRRRGIMELINIDDPAALQPYTPEFDYVLWDVAHMDRGRVEFTLEVRAFLEIMHHINRRSLDQALPQIAHMLSQAANEHSSILEKIETYMRYAVDCNEHIDETTIERSLDASNTKEELMPTLAQKWFGEAEARGEARGKAEGIIGGQSKLLRKQIQMRFGQIPPEVESRIANATEEDLEHFAENVLEANSALEVVEFKQE
jgi:predicted transposase/invertase (TIGR01784 family)